MSIQTPGYPVHGIFPMTAPDSTVSSGSKTPVPETPDTSVRAEDLEVNDLSRLARLVRSNEQLVERLRSVSDRLRCALNYLERADANIGLGTDYYRYWRSKH